MIEVNFDYLQTFNEFPLFCGLIFSNMFKKKQPNGSGRILIVNTCLIGEFAASLPALRDFIQRNRGTVIDLVVSSPLKPLAEKIIGIRNVFMAKSLLARDLEDAGQELQPFDTYEKTIVLRASPDVYRLMKTISTGTIKTGALPFSRYALHLAKNLILGRTPKTWAEVNFEMLGGRARPMPFDDLFRFEKADYARVEKLSALKSRQKKIIIHTGASWVMNRWSNENWVELLARLHGLDNFRFILVGAKKDNEDCACIASRLPFRVYSLIGEIDIAELVLTLRASDYFIGIDSGPRNMAHVADVPSITILGPAPHIYTPPNTRDIVLDKSRGRGLYQRFFYKRNGVIDTIRPEEVFAAFRDRLYRCDERHLSLLAHRAFEELDNDAIDRP